MENDYKNLHSAALTLSTKMMADLPQTQLDLISHYSKQGARIVLELDLPDCKTVALLLRELEGRTHAICKLGINTIAT